MEETEPGKENIVELKKALMMAPALGLPDLTKTFALFVHEEATSGPWSAGTTFGILEAASRILL